MHAKVLYATTNQKLANQLAKKLQAGQTLEGATQINNEQLDNILPEADYSYAFMNTKQIPQTTKEWSQQHGGDTLRDIFLPDEFRLDKDSNPYYFIFKQRITGYEHYYKCYLKAIEHYLQATRLVKMPLNDIDMYRQLKKLSIKQQDFVLDAKAAFENIYQSRGTGKIALLEPDKHKCIIDDYFGMNEQLVQAHDRQTYYVFPQQMGDFHF